MTGIPNFNASAFNKAESELRTAGWFPINPIAVDAAAGDTYEEERSTGVWESKNRISYLLRDLEIIMSKDDPIEAIYMLQGWEKSPGAKTEHAVAIAQDKTVYYELPGGKLPSSLSVLGPRPDTWPHERNKADTGRMTAREFLVAKQVVKDETILQEAQRLVHGPRGIDYGHPLDDFTRTAGLLNALGFRRRKEDQLIAEDIALIMICVKLSRESFSHKRDNLTDICGYAETLMMVLEKRYAQTPPWSDGCGPTPSSR